MHRPGFTLLLALSWSALWAAEGPKPWETSIAALTDPRAAVYEPAIERLIAYGPEALADVARLANDANWQVRGRVITVASAIGGQPAVAVVLAASRDDDPRVRELSALGLGKLRGEGLFPRLIELLNDRQSSVRIAAARGLVDLVDARALVVLADQATELDAEVCKVRMAGLERLAMRPDVVPALVDTLGTVHGDVRLRLIMATGRVGDPRFSPALAALVAGKDREAAMLAAQSLAANGDSRCLAALCAAAASGPRDLATTAAATLRVLTDFRAAPGQAWTVWWRDHAADVASIAERDAFVAALHDPAYTVSADELGHFHPNLLMVLVDGVLGDGAWWWPSRATQVLLRDQPARWTEPLLSRIRATEDPDVRLELIMLLDQLGDPAAAPGFATILADNRARIAAALKAGGKPHNDPTGMALEAAIARRKPPGADPGPGAKPAFMK